MTLVENARKAIIYFQPVDTYWKKSMSGDPSGSNGGLGVYPISIAPRIADGHHAYLSPEGVPLWPDRRGVLVPHCTTMCSYALGHWEIWLATGNLMHLERFMVVAEYLCSWGKVGDFGAFLWLNGSADSRAHFPCAMSQGEGISVLCRAFEVTGKSDFLETAKAAVIPFFNSFGPTGVVREVGDIRSTWYLEAGKAILNGHIYALFGLNDLRRVVNDDKVDQAFRQGSRSVVDNLAKFDSGYWSWYWLEDRRYIASMMYHNLHIVQLEALAEIACDERLANFAKVLRGYAARPYCRFRAAWELFRAKTFARGNS